MAPASRAAQMVARVGERPPVGHGGHHDHRVEDGERRRHQLARHLAHDRPAAGEVGRAVGQCHLAGLARARAEAQLDIGGMALGREVHLPDHGLQGRSEAAGRRDGATVGYRHGRDPRRASPRRALGAAAGPSLGKMMISPSRRERALATSAEFLVSSSGQMSVPAAVRRRWGLTEGGRLTVIDLGDAVVLLPPGGRQRLLADALSAEDHLDIVANLDDPDLADELSGHDRRRRPPAARHPHGPAPA